MRIALTGDRGKKKRLWWGGEKRVSLRAEMNSEQGKVKVRGRRRERGLWA